MPIVNADRLLKDLCSLREFGTYKTGVHRPTYSQIDMAARKWLTGRMADAGLDAQIDGIGNVIGRSNLRTFRFGLQPALSMHPWH